MRSRSHRYAVTITILCLVILTGLGVLFVLVRQLREDGGAIPFGQESRGEETADLSGEPLPAFGGAEPIRQQTADPASSAQAENITSDVENAESQSGEPEQAPQEPEITPVTLMFTGDVLFDYSFNTNYPAHGVSGIVDDGFLSEMRDADILTVNEEFPFGTTGTPWPDKQFTFRVDPKYVSVLTELGVDLVSLANNHTMDFGASALQETFETLDGEGIPYIGAGENKARAKQLHIIEAGGKRFGFLAASRVVPSTAWYATANGPGLFTTYDPAELLECIREARPQVDFLTVFVHWGIERNEYPEEYQRTMGRQYIEAGADLVIGSHPHVLQGIQYFDGKPVFYSLGNYIFNQTTSRTAAVKVTVSPEGEASYRILPGTIKGGKTTLYTGEDALGLYGYLEGISEKVRIGEDGTVTEAGN
ncbi:MAG: CapA family protein [Lachnospiraceae bacterium]|nr:CapA family protein [Lachnospiraceae bacterium]